MFLESIVIKIANIPYEICKEIQIGNCKIKVEQILFVSY